MKRLFSKRSGFTLVEIIIAFAIFAIMASMIVQVLNLMVRQKVRNRKFEDNLSTQEEQFIARPKNMDYTATTADGQLTLLFKDKGGSDLTVDPIDYQLKNWDPDNYKNGINYFTGDYEYDIDLAGSERLGDEDDPDSETDPMDLGGTTQMSRFDTRITGTKGILTVTIDVTEIDSKTISVTVTVVDSGVAKVNKSHSQVSIFFAENKSKGKAFEIASVNDGDKTQSSLKRVKLCGANGVNVHCTGDGFNGGSETFTVKFKNDVDVTDIGFGSNGTESVNPTTNTHTYKYNQFAVTDKDSNETIYANIFGAYAKGGTTVEATPGGDTPGGDTPGGDTPGGDTPGGDTPGGDGGDTTTPGGESTPEE